MGRGATLQTVGLSMLLVRNPMLSQPSHSNGMCGHLDGKDIDHHLSVINPTQNMIRRHPMAGDVGSPGLYNVRYSSWSMVTFGQIQTAWNHRYRHHFKFNHEGRTYAHCDRFHHLDEELANRLPTRPRYEQDSNRLKPSVLGPLLVFDNNKILPHLPNAMRPIFLSKMPSHYDKDPKMVSPIERPLVNSDFLFCERALGYSWDSTASARIG